ncbi:MAG: TIGR03790 family protein [Rubrivivax sp.]|nr:TIGR03790 family protein [Rubrivivax sp.]
MRRWLLLAAAALALSLPQWLPVQAQTASPTASAPGSTASPAPSPRRWMGATRASGRLTAPAIGLVINVDDAYSVEVGAHYIARRGLQPAQVLRLSLPLHASLSVAEFQRLQQQIADHFGPEIQALALAWVAPYAVECQSITGSLALGFDPDLCQRSCAPSRSSSYFNSASSRPLADHGWRPSMLLAAPSAAQGKELIDRGAAADHSLALRERAPVQALFVATDDAARRVRMALYPPPGLLRSIGVEIQELRAGALQTLPRLLLVSTGSVRVGLSPAPDWVSGGLGDHLTSFGGQLAGTHGQSTALDWIASGATASHGAVSEPCNHLQKFPHPQVLLLHYLQGSTAIEAYWKSVAWPQQSLFIGEPLAAPFARP